MYGTEYIRQRHINSYYKHARQHWTSNCSRNMTSTAWLYCTCSARFIRAEKEPFYTEQRGKEKKMDSCVMKVSTEGPLKRCKHTD